MSIATTRRKIEGKMILRVADALVLVVRDERGENMKKSKVLFYHLIICDCARIDRNIDVV